MLMLAVIFWSCWALIAYAYVVFPFVLSWFAGRVRDDRDRLSEEYGAAELPRVAMVVAAYNEATVLPAKLANTRAIDYPADLFELVIGSDGSDDGTNDILRAAECHGLRPVLFEQRRGKISVLNDVLRAIDADIVVMSDANTMFDPRAVRLLVNRLLDPRVGCVSGKLCLDDDGGVSGEGLYWRYESWIKECESRLGFLIGCNGGIFALRRDLYEPLPATTIVEDFVLSMRVLERGLRVVLEPRARATEPPCASAKAEMVRKIRIGAGGWQALGLTSGLLHPRHGLRAFAYWGHKVLRWMVPLFMVAAFLASAALVRRPVYCAAFLLQLGAAVTAAAAYNHAIGERLPRITRPVSYFYLMNYALLRGLLRFLLGRQRVTWERAASPVGGGAAHQGADKLVGGSAVPHAEFKVNLRPVASRSESAAERVGDTAR